MAKSGEKKKSHAQQGVSLCHPRSIKVSLQAIQWMHTSRDFLLHCTEILLMEGRWSCNYNHSFTI